MTAKVLFIFPDFSKSLGVRNKIVSKLNHISDLSPLELHVLILGDEGAELRNDFNPNIRIYYTGRPTVKSRLLRLTIFWSWLFEKEYQRLFREAKKVYDQVGADFVVMRDTPGSNSLFLFCKAISNKAQLIIELNSDLLEEKRMLYKRDEANKWNKLAWQKEAATKPKILKAAKNLVCVSDEIAHIHHNRYRLPKNRFRVITNGIDYKSRRLAKMPDNHNELKCVFLGGAGDSYYKVERAIESLANYSGDRRVVLSVVGIERENIEKPNHAVRFHPKVSYAELGSYLDGQHLGISTLGLYKKNLENGSTLKVREYLMAGIPVVLGYSDVDILEDCPYAFRVPNSDERLNFESIFDYALGLYANANLRSEISDYFESKISMESKAQEFLALFN
jgi:glycosyltransferase involved in cell wall biosynthesis